MFLSNFFFDIDEISMNVLFLQILLVLMLIVSFFEVLFLYPLSYLQGLFVILYAFFLYQSLKIVKNKIYFGAFFIFLILIVQVSIFARMFFETFDFFQFFSIIIVFFIAFMYIFSFVLGKKNVVGKVLLSDKKTAVVKISFDLPTLISSGKYVVESDKEYKKGTKVLIAVGNKFFSRKPVKIIGEEK